MSSFAFGHITLASKKQEVLRGLHSLFREFAEDWTYNTVLWDDFGEWKIKKGTEEGDFVFVSYFTGLGDGSYENNVRHFFPWIVEDMNDFGHIKNQKFLPILAMIQQNDFRILFEYTNEDKESKLLCKETCALVHEEGDPLMDTQFERKAYGSMEHNATNLIALDCYDYVWDTSNPVFFDVFADYCENPKAEELKVTFHRLHGANQEPIMKMIGTRFPKDKEVHYGIEELRSNPKEVWDYLCKVVRIASKGGTMGKAIDPEMVGQIIDIFEDFLEEKGIEIPNEERKESGEDAAILYGTDYGNLENQINHLLQLWMME